MYNFASLHQDRLSYLSRLSFVVQTIKLVNATTVAQTILGPYHTQSWMNMNVLTTFTSLELSILSRCKYPPSDSPNLTGQDRKPKICSLMIEAVSILGCSLEE